MQDIKEKRDEDLLVLPTDAALFEDPSFKVENTRLDVSSFSVGFCFLFMWRF